MTQEEKEDILLKDISCRMPYGVMITDGLRTVKLKVTARTQPVSLAQFIHSDLQYYLRPMSSMTEEESNEIDKFRATFQVGDESYDVFNHVGYVDWLNAHHFDYRGLIKKGLALEAPKGMYEKGDME